MEQSARLTEIPPSVPTPTERRQFALSAMWVKHRYPKLNPSRG